MTERNILLMGLPSSGKTTFIAALWYHLSKATNGTIKLKSIVGENDYLDEICNSWMQFEKVPRTNPSANNAVKISVQTISEDSEATLVIPDFSGEVYRDHFDTHEWSKSFDQLLDEVNGIILFVNPAEVNNRPNYIVIENEILRYFGEEPETVPNSIEEWNVGFVPHQVKLVGLLQNLVRQKTKRSTFKLSVVISAWDLVLKNPLTNNNSPAQWVANYLPLLFQYLECNSNSLETQYYGVSAQGLDYDQDDIVNSVTVNPLSRIIVREEDVTSSDLGKIIWSAI
jgi:hypothetical protein